MSLPEKRQWKTGVWTFTISTPSGRHVLALSEWGTQYEFTKEAWEALPIIEHNGAAAADASMP